MGSLFTIEHIKDGNYVRISVHVPVTREVADEFAQQAQYEVERLGCNGSLVDVRGFHNESSVNDNVEYSAWDLKVTGAKAKMKRAVLTDVDDETHDLPILAMQEMGFNAKKFTDEQEAIAWLTGSG
jgi:hypothetical protein